MINKLQCHEIRELLSLYLDNELTKEEINLVESHLAYCPACKKEYLEMQEITDMLREIPNDELPEQFEFRLRKALADEGKKIRANHQTDAVKMKINWRLFNSIAAVLVVGIISYVSFTDVQILPTNIVNITESETANLENTKNGKIIDKNNKEKEQTTEKKEENQDVPLVADSNIQSMDSDKSNLEEKEESNKKEMLSTSDNNDKTSADDTIQLKSLAPMEDMTEEYNKLDVINNSTMSTEESMYHLSDQSNQSKNITSLPSVSINSQTKEYYEEMISEKLEGFQYKITSSAYKDYGQWDFVVFIYTGKDGNIINKEIQVIGKGGQIQVLYADEFMGL